MADAQHEREVRAARNQAMFRATNEKLTALNEAWSETLAEPYVIACECADMDCIETLTITADEYEAVRREPNRFAILSGHICPDVEAVVGERERFVVVEKFGAAAPVAEALDARS